MMQNVVEVDTSMLQTGLCEADSAAIFFDFQAAFPSVAHEFLLAALRHAGLPER